MASSSRTPPRFVPTLTTVVEIPEAPPELPTAAPPSPAEAPELSTFGNMIEDLSFMPLAPAPAAAQAFAGAPAVQLPEEEAFRLEEELLHRVLQRVDLSLEERLTDTVSAAVQRQLDDMLPRLRREIEGVLRAVVVEALAQELSETPGSTPTFRPSNLG
jgi:hypothetical protein